MAVSIEVFRNDPNYKIIPTKFGDETIEVIYRKMRTPRTREESEALPPEEQDMFSIVAPFNQRTYQVGEDIICHQDVACQLRDGTTIYADLFVPKDSGPVPFIISWSPFGKRPADGLSEWQLMGVSPGTVSTSAKFESADPEYWCRCGYGIANVDPRGIGHSEGDAVFMGTQDGRDGYDFIEWLATTEWSNGRIAMFGNSGVGMAQTRVAAECPPHLTCIAPWECTGDLFRESMREGGIRGEYAESVIGTVAGPGYIEDPLHMADVYPEWNAYWQDKVPKFRNIRIPAYFTSNYNHFHNVGSFESFMKSRSRKKWFRVHREFEWPDTYDRDNIDDLRKFYDRYLKDIRNGWESTPKIRLSVMDAYTYDYQVNRPEKEWPLARTQYKDYFLDCDGTMKTENPENEGKCSFTGEKGILTFDYKFEEDTEITGYMSFHGYVSVDNYDDGDIFFTVQKMGQDGVTEVPIHVLDQPHPGAWTKLRLSYRELSESLSTPYRPEQSFRIQEKLVPGQVYHIEVSFVPYSRIWHKGETLRLRLAGNYIREDWFERLYWQVDNQGTINVHTGGKYDTRLTLPVIPPRWQSGDYIYR